MRKLFTTTFFASVAWAVLVFGFCVTIALYMSARDYADYYKLRLDIERAAWEDTATEVALQRELNRRLEADLAKEKEVNEVLSDLASASAAEAKELRKKYENPL